VLLVCNPDSTVVGDTWAPYTAPVGSLYRTDAGPLASEVIEF